MSHVTRQISRRSMLRAAGATAGAVGAGIGIGIGTSVPAAAAGASFAHPGLLHTRADLDRMAARVKAGAQPYTAGFAELAANPHARSDWRPRPSAVVHRGAGSPQNYAALYKDIHAAYQNALRWHITGESAHADTAVAILNAWSATLTRLAGSADRFLAAGLYGYQFANAAELVRDHEDFEAERFRGMLLDVFHPLSESFLAHHNNAVVTNYWTNWDLCNMACVLAIGIHCDDRAKVDRVVEYFKHGEGLGSVRNAIPVVYDDGLGEWLEAGRDQGHALLGVGLMGTICEMAWNQGIDLYGHDDNRFLKGAQYVAKWAMGGEVPFTANTRRKGAIGGWSGSETVTEAAAVNPEMTRPIWAMIANHYTRRRSLPASYVTRIAARSAPEGGGGNYGPDSGGYDQLGFGTLAFTRERTTGAAGAAGTGGSPSATAAAGGAAGAGDAAGARSGADPRPQTATTASPSASPAGGDLAATGSNGLLGWTAATGVTALAGGLLLLRRRDRARREPQ